MSEAEVTSLWRVLPSASDVGSVCCQFSNPLRGEGTADVGTCSLVRLVLSFFFPLGVLRSCFLDPRLY